MTPPRYRRWDNQVTRLFSREVVVEQDPEPFDALDNEEQHQYTSGKLDVLCVYAKAHIVVGGVTQIIYSGGTYGILASTADYPNPQILEDIKKEEDEELTSILEKLGIKE